MLARIAFALAALVGLAAPALCQVAAPTTFNALRVLVPGAVYSPSGSWRAACSSAGWLRFVMADGSLYDVYVSVGTGGEDGISIIGLAASGPSPAAACVVSGLYYRRLELER